MYKQALRSLWIQSRWLVLSLAVISFALPLLSVYVGPGAGSSGGQVASWLLGSERVGLLLPFFAFFSGMMMGITVWNFRIALGLNGVGWNFLFVGATTLLTTTYRPAERGKAQAFNDFMVFGTTTVASLMASVVLELEGWAVLNYLALALVLVAFLVIGLFRLRHPAGA